MTRPGLISDEQVQAALDWLADNAEAMGQAVMRARLAERYVGHIEALQSKAADGSDARRKEAARTSEAYRNAIYDEAVTAGELAKLRSLKDRHEALIEAWRSQSANHRALL